MWKISVYYCNVESIGGVPEVCAEEDVALWCKEAESLSSSYCSIISLVYDSVNTPVEFNPEKLRLYSILFSNPEVLSLSTVIPTLSAVSVKPTVPTNIIFE